MILDIKCWIDVGFLVVLPCINRHNVENVGFEGHSVFKNK